jgi:hypothetical protein
LEGSAFGGFFTFVQDVVLSLTGTSGDEFKGGVVEVEDVVDEREGRDHK